MFPKGISPKVNVIAQLEIEFAYADVTVKHINHPPPWIYMRIYIYSTECQDTVQDQFLSRSVPYQS